MLPALLWGGYYLARRDLLVGLAAMAASYGLALRVDHPASVDPGGQWLFSVAYLGLAAWVTHIVSRRLNSLLDESREASLVDALTGLSNRRRLFGDLAALGDGDERHVLVLFDLNGFKPYNDRHGHLQGDEVLREVSARLTEALGAAGTAYRLGGDEFCAVLHGDEKGAHAALVAAIRAFSVEDRGHHIDAAWGAVAIPDEGRAATELLKLADERMYACKALQRDATGAALVTVP